MKGCMTHSPSLSASLPTSPDLTLSLAMSSSPRRSSSAELSPLALVPANASVITELPLDRNSRSGVQPRNAVVALGCSFVRLFGGGGGCTGKNKVFEEKGAGKLFF